MKRSIENFKDQCKKALGLGKKISKIQKVEKIIVLGMGASGFAGDVLKAIVRNKLDVSINKDYFLSEKVDKKSLVFAISYSGETEETLSATNDAFKKGLKIIGIGTGGSLEKFCTNKKLDFIKVPEGVQPRDAMGYLVVSMINVLEKNGFIREREENVPGAIDAILIKKKAKKIADILFNKVPVIYSSESLRCIGEGFKTRINENSKVPAFFNRFPEMNHNEIVGYVKKIANVVAIIIRDKSDYERIKKRYLITQKIIRKYGGECVIIDTFGVNLISRIFNTLHLADWVSYYLSEKYGVDPEKVKIIQELKKKLKDK